MTFRDLSCVAIREDVCPRDTVEKDNKCDSEEHRHQNCIDDVENRVSDAADGAGAADGQIPIAEGNAEKTPPVRNPADD